MRRDDDTGGASAGTDGARPRPRAAWASRKGAMAAALVAFALALFFGSWKDRASMSGDPIVYAQIGREIVERGDPTRLTFDGRLAARKPPLAYWLEAASFAAFGYREGAARLPSCVMGAATVALLFALVAPRRGRRAALWAGLACLAFPVFQRTSHQARLDTTLAFFSLAALGAFLRMDRRGFTVPRALAVGALAGLAVLAKGPPGLLVAVAIAVGAGLARRGALLRRSAPWAALALLVVGGSWYALQLAREGSAWWSQLRADWSRDSAPVQTVREAVAFYATDVLLPAAPWVVAFALGTALALGRWRRDRARGFPEVLSIAFVAAFVAALPPLSMHYGRYFALVVPSIAWVGGVWLAPAVRRAARRLGSFRVERALVLGLLVAALAGYPAYVAHDEAGDGKYPDLEAASADLHRAAPGARAMPVWTAAMERGEGDGLSRVTVAAARFYYDMPFVRFDDSDPALPPFVLFLHGDGGPSETASFEAAHRFPVVRRTAKSTLYRTR